jgi:hypothetical protein
LIVIDRIDIGVLDEGYDRNVDVAVIDDGVFQLRQQIVGRCLERSDFAAVCLEPVLSSTSAASYPPATSRFRANLPRIVRN